MKRVCLTLCAMVSIWPVSLLAVDTGAVVGGAVGGGVGAAVGSEVGGRGGAIVGSAIGAAAGTAILAEDSKNAKPAEPVHVQTPAYHAPPGPSYQHIPPGHAKHWHKHKHKYR